MPKKNMKDSFKKAKKGATSLVVTMVTVIILGIITLGFIRIVVSESTQTSNNDLAQSAYDSALAGVEDAKIAILKYHECLNSGYTKESAGTDTRTMECKRIINAIQDGIKTQDCDTIQKALGREQDDDKGVIIQESSTNSNDMVQSYTCVTVKEDLDDYRTTLSNSDRIRMIPLRADDGMAIENIELDWFYTDTNFDKTCKKDGSSNNLEPKGECKNPMISLSIVQTDETFKLSELTTANGEGKTDRGTLYLKPYYSTSSTVETIKAKEWSNSSDKNANMVRFVKCNESTSFWCNLKIELPKTFNDSTKRNSGTSFLIITLPYGQQTGDDTKGLDLSVRINGKTLDNASNPTGSATSMPFRGVQARIDSTGRANDLYRRVETRLELVDTYFPYPEFEIQMIGESPSTITKNFYVTEKCWYFDNGATPQTCHDNDELH